MGKRFFKALKLLPAALMIISAALFAYTEALPFAQREARNKSAKQTKEFSPWWSGVPSGAAPFGCCSKAKPWVINTLPHETRWSGRQSLSLQTPKTESKTSKQNPRPVENQATPSPTEIKPTAEPTRYSYEFSQPQFHIRHIVIEHDANGRGKITFERLHEETPIVESLQLSAAALSRVSALWQALGFLDSDADYQSGKQFPHLGTVRLTMQQGTRKRTAEFNWTSNKAAFALMNEYRRVVDQAIFVFDLSVARENQPLNAPKLMEQFESMFKRGWLSDPQQLIPLLKEISTDEHLPLIARNHALRLLKKIEK